MILDILQFVLNILLGAILLLFYMVWRMIRSGEIDDSNILNPLRLISHKVAHPGDFVEMVYLTTAQRKILEVMAAPVTDDQYPFWYLLKDEFESVVKTRPPNEERR